MKGFGLAAAVLLLAGVFAAWPASAADVQTQLTEETGPTDLLGGGDHRFIRFGADAAFGVLWGTAANPNNVYLVAIKARYLGVADVRTQAGASVDTDRPLKVYTIYAVKLENLVEFDDTNGDGVATFWRAFNGENYTQYQWGTEPLYKYASLKAAWTASNVTRTDDGAGNRTWEFSLEATNLPYSAMNGTPVSAGNLNKLTFTFHLKVTMVHVDGVVVPKYTVEVTRLGERYLVGEVTRAGTTTWSGDRLAYELKWDQRIEGWDFDGANADPRLSLEMHALVANRIPTDKPAWMDQIIIWKTNENGCFRWRDGAGERCANETTGTYTSPRKFTSPWLRSGGDWSYIGNLTWVSEATVDGNPGQVYAQIQGINLGLVRTGGAVYVGFVALLGLSFPGGQDIDHDPTFASDAFEITTAAEPPRFSGLVLLVLIVAAVAVVVALVASRKKDKNGPIQQAHRQEQQPREEDWNKYYER